MGAEIDMAAIELPSGSFGDALRFTLQWEGGFADDPRDPGGATQYGISLRFLRSLHPSLADIDGDGDVDGADVLALDLGAAIELYRSQFWAPLGIDGYPWRAQLALFDAAVNLGRRRAVSVSQAALRRCGCARLAVDGVLGEQTRRGILAHGGGVELAAHLTIERTRHYRDICRKDIKLRRYLYGWLDRTLSLGDILRAGTL